MQPDTIELYPTNFSLRPVMKKFNLWSTHLWRNGQMKNREKNQENPKAKVKKQRP